MKIHRKQAAAMIENNAAAGEKKTTHQHHATMISRHDFSSHRRGQIRTGMGRTRRTVDDTPGSERRCRSLLGYWANERRLPQRFRRRERERARESGLLAADLFERFWTHLVEARRHVE